MSQVKLESLDPKTTAYKVLCLLSFKGTVYKPAEIAALLKENGSTVRARLAELKKQGLVDQKSDGYFSLVSPYDFIIKIYNDLGSRE